MAENATPFRAVKGNATDAVNRVKSGVDELIDLFDVRQFSEQVKQFGREKPVALAFAALTVGVAAGLLMRRSIQGQFQAGSKTADRVSS